MTQLEEIITSLYDFRITDDWDDIRKQEIFIGIYDLSNALEELTKINASIIYNRVFGGVAFNISYSLRGNLAHAYVNSISYQPNIKIIEIIRFLTVHELWHVFDIRNAISVNFIKEREGVYTPSGKFITGWNPIRQGYYRDGGIVAPDNGYLSDNWKKGYRIHPPEMYEGGRITEDLADMLRNFVYKSFAANEAGETLNRWFENKMIMWLKPYLDVDEES